MEEPLPAKGQRPRLTCTECHRRKIKCDKTIPCNTCVKRGYADHCTREEDEAPTVPLVEIAENVKASHEVIRSLLDRVKQLEDQLSSNASPAQPVPLSPHASMQSLHSHDQNDRAETSALAPPNAVDFDSPARGDPGSVVPEDNDAATVLEFLAWGRNKDVQYGSKTIRVSQALMAAQHEDACPIANAMFDANKQATFDLLETLLPDHTKIQQLVEYHSTYVLWYHGSFSAWIFNTDLSRFFNDHNGDIRHPDFDIQWMALLFAVLTGSLACAPTSVRHSWGFRDAESSRLALQWYEACVTCLNAGQYIERHTIHSIEAICTLTISAHILGRSNSQSVLLSSAARIAQSLGLHRLNTNSQISMEQMRRIEAGRRVFNQLCTQDWFQIPFSESYSMSPNFIVTGLPTNCNDDDLEYKPKSVPTQTSYCNYRYEIAALMPRLLDASSACNTLFTKYEQVLKYDEKMRRLATASMPAFLSTNEAIDPDWPAWIGWGRRSLAICASHKIIMIHRRFLGLSFTNSAFSFTRRTCVAAAKTILKEALSANDQDGPILWIEQAFSVAAGIVLCLDIAHRDPQQEDLDYHANLMERTIGYLRSFETSKIACRGVHLLQTLQEEVQRGLFRSHGKRRREDAGDMFYRPSKQIHRALNVPHLPQSALVNSAALSANHTLEPIETTIESSDWDEQSYRYPIDITLGPQGLFDDLLSFQF